MKKRPLFALNCVNNPGANLCSKTILSTLYCFISEALNVSVSHTSFTLNSTADCQSQRQHRCILQSPLMGPIKRRGLLPSGWVHCEGPTRPAPSVFVSQLHGKCEVSQIEAASFPSVVNFIRTHPTKTQDIFTDATSCTHDADLVTQSYGQPCLCN